MRFTPTTIPGAYLVEIAPHADARGFFARTVCEEEFASHGLNARFVQQSVSHSLGRGILRGMHFQAAPHEEEKLVRVTSGAIWDVILDLRPASPSYRRWFGIELSAQNHTALYIPKGVAHGLQTLTDSAEVMYQMTAPYVPNAERGVLWSDSAFGIAWPVADPIVSARDQSHPLWQHLFGEQHDPSL
jgi:dTDP-4-dehydrorhamnose 3,5-epimerase